MSESWRKDSVYRDGSLNFGRLALYAIMILRRHHLGRALPVDVRHLDQAG